LNGNDSKLHICNLIHIALFFFSFNMDLVVLIFDQNFRQTTLRAAHTDKEREDDEENCAREMRQLYQNNTNQKRESFLVLAKTQSRFKHAFPFPLFLSWLSSLRFHPNPLLSYVMSRLRFFSLRTNRR